MRNDELFSPNCPNDKAKKLVKAYVMHGLLDDHGTYYPDDLLVRQHAVYEAWLATMRKHITSFECGFHEWMRRDCDSAFVLKQGDLVKYSGQYCVVIMRPAREVTWLNGWRIRNGAPSIEAWPNPVREVELKDSNGKVFVVDALCGSIEPADIPPEVFALACEKSKSCPMMKGG